VFASMRSSVLAVLALSFGLAACTGDPWVDRRREAGQENTYVGKSTLDRVAICYAPGEVSAERLHEMAAEECAKTDRVPSFVGIEKWQCRLLTPHRAYYDCL